MNYSDIYGYSGHPTLSPTRRTWVSPPSFEVRDILRFAEKTRPHDPKPDSLNTFAFHRAPYPIHYGTIDPNPVF